MHFGDRPAAAGLEVAKKKVAELGREIDSQTADIIMRGYVDDGLGGGEEYVVKKLIGEETFHTQGEGVSQPSPSPIGTGCSQGSAGREHGLCSLALAATSPDRSQESSGPEGYKEAFKPYQTFQVPPEIDDENLLYREKFAENLEEFTW